MGESSAFNERRPHHEDMFLSPSIGPCLCSVRRDLRRWRRLRKIVEWLPLLQRRKGDRRRYIPPPRTTLPPSGIQRAGNWTKRFVDRYPEPAEETRLGL